MTKRASFPFASCCSRSRSRSRWQVETLKSWLKTWGPDHYQHSPQQPCEIILAKKIYPPLVRLSTNSLGNVPVPYACATLPSSPAIRSRHIGHAQCDSALLYNDWAVMLPACAWRRRQLLLLSAPARPLIRYPGPNYRARFFIGMAQNSKNRPNEPLFY